ncbi:PREDICTED: uncharacterized protein LOC107069795 [Polistes dominula]|uniref:Neuroendocrine protein 7B2 n=1 Tax=Polistes dominula TaxID=743375 RepID=A0ABM1IRQ5_POLDO|nr:PREDICTED: uncharacterized protein LOC107069795 [Polistes dominula]
MPHCFLLLSIAVATQAAQYLSPTIQDDRLWDTSLQVVLDSLNKLNDVVDSYVDYVDNFRLPDDFDKAKEIPIDLPADYEADTFNPNPSIRDQEYLQHSTLWSHQHANDYYRGNDRHRIQAAGIKGGKDEKTENALPAYCTPPNPCPIGYTSENNCLTEFENTATFSRHYQSLQDCMCDTEHMADCPSNSNGLPGMRISNSDFAQIVEEFREENPFFQGEKLPIAAKKGINVVY